MEKTQSELFLESEGDEWFNRTDPEKPFYEKHYHLLAEWCSHRKNRISKILEIGAGNGYPLSILTNALDAEGFGIEPSSKAVKLWKDRKRKVKSGINTSLQVGVAHKIPFLDTSFDLIVFGFCFYLFDRKELFRSIAEADRVLKDGGLIAIIDFDPSKPFSNKYVHKNGIMSYKNNYSNIFLSSGHYSLVNKYSFSHQSFNFVEDDNERISISLLFKQEENIYKNWSR